MACIVLINHDPLQLYVLTMLLEQDHDEIVSRARIEDSLKVLEARDDIDGIVLDLHAGKVDWWRSYQEVKMSMYCSHCPIPILAVSSYYTEAEAEQICAEFQVDTFLSFPVDPQRFRQYVHQLAEKSLSLTHEPEEQCNLAFKKASILDVKYDHANAMLSLTSVEE